MSHFDFTAPALEAKDGHLCPCGTKLSFDNCCQPIISGKFPAPSAIALMRARFTAYVARDFHFLRRTAAPKVSLGFIDEEETRTEWLALEIQRFEDGENDAKVEFSAYHRREGRNGIHVELSNFQKIDGAWIYQDADRIGPTPIVNIIPKPSRNMPCSCGSGLKYKKCCGK